MKQNLIQFTTAVVLLLSVAYLSSSCTSNQWARSYGGTQTITLDPGQRLVNVTWKEDNLWLLVKPDTTAPKKYTFAEKSSMGVWEGTVEIIEK